MTENKSHSSPSINQEFETIYDHAIKEGITIGRKEGIAIGRKEGIAIGRKEGRQEIIVEKILNAYQKNIPMKEIASVLDLSEEEVHQILTNKKSHTLQSKS